MATLLRFEDINVWKKSRILTNYIYNITEKFNDRGLKDQMRRASASIMANIAEGFERSGNREFIQFLSISKGSTAELISHLYIALDRQYIDSATFDRIYGFSKEIIKETGGFMTYLRKAKMKGIKYK